MVTTRSAGQPSAKDMFSDLLTNVIIGNNDKDHPIRLMVKEESVDTLSDFMAIANSDFHTLQYQPLPIQADDGTTSTPSKQRLMLVHQNTVRIFQVFVHKLRADNNNKQLTHIQWGQVTHDLFDDFKMTPEAHRDPKLSAPGLNKNARTPANEFQKSIKRDKTQYKDFKDQKYWDSWHRSFLVTAKSHGLEDVLNSGYLPSTSEDKALFHEKQKFAFSVLDHVIHTNMGKTIVRKHTDSMNAQQAYAEITQFYSSSTLARQNASDLIQYCTSARYTSEWRGTASSFILHWNTQLDNFHELTTTEKHISESLRIVLLENAVHPVSELRQVKTSADVLATKDGKALTWDGYYGLLLSAALAYDKQRQPQRSSRRVNYTDILGSDDSPDPWEYAIDSDPTVDLPPMDFLQIHASKQSTSPPPKRSSPTLQTTRIEDATWRQLPRDVQQFLSAAFRDRRDSTTRPRTVRMHEIIDEDDTPKVTFLDDEVEETPTQDTSTLDDTADDNTQLLAHLTNQSRLPPGDIKRVLSNSNAKKPASRNNKDRRINVCVQYNINQTVTGSAASLMDSGANGGMAGDDVIIVEKTNRKVDITGLDNHQVNNLDIVTAAGLVHTQRGPCILLLHQYAYLGKGKSIHSKGQVEHYKNNVDDKSAHLGGKQRVVTLDGYIIPLQIRNGLAFLDMQPPTQSEMETLPHITFTADIDWDPRVLDSEIDPDSVSDHPLMDDNDLEPYGNDLFNDIGTLNERVVAEHSVTTREPNYVNLRRHFGWVPADIIQTTFQHTTQFARQAIRDHNLRVHFRSRFPACNVRRRGEPVACDIVYSDYPAICGQETSAVFFVGRSTKYASAYSVKTDSQFINTLEDEIRKHGAMDKLISDRAQVEISKKVQDLLRALFVDDWQSEPYHQNQNYAERFYQEIKHMVNTILNRTGAPGSVWFLCLLYCIFIHNRLARKSLHNETPFKLLTGQTPDISALLQYSFWEPVYYYCHEDKSFPSSSDERQGHWVGISESVGDALTYKILTDDTQKIIHRSAIRTAADPSSANLRALDEGDGEPSATPPTVFVKSRSDAAGSPSIKNMPGFKPDDLIGRTFLQQPEENGERHRAQISKKITYEDDDERVDFLITKGNGQPEEIIAYNEILAHIERNNKDEQDSNGEQVWRFRDITAHQGPLTEGHKSYKGSSWNVLVEWETGETTYEPLNMIAKDDPVTCAAYAKRNGLLDTPGWKRFKQLAKREKVIRRMINQTQRQQKRYAPKYKFGVEIPRNHKHAMELQAKYGHRKWSEAEMVEIGQLVDYSSFIDCGVAQYDGKRITNIPPGYKRIFCHMIYDVKHDGRYKSRFVGGGHLTAIPTESVYSGVVSLRSLRLIIFLSEHNGLKLYAADIGNAYLEAFTKEHVCFIAGPEFGDLEGHVFKISKALYGLRTSGARWHERFAEVLGDMGFFPSKGDPDVWMRPAKDCYEYIAVYVDDLCIAAKDPEEIINTLKNKYKFKLKGDGPLKYHLGCDFFRDPDGTLSYAPKKYIEKILANYNLMFNEKPKEYSSPLEKGDHPEIDTSPCLDEDGIRKYQSLIGTLQWLITLGRFDISSAVTSMSRFRASPREGHLKRLQRIFGYIRKFKDASIRVRTGEPDLSDLPDQDFDWTYSVYGETKEQIPDDIPPPLGNSVTLITYKDANLWHDYITGKALTGVMHFINQTLYDWYCKAQATVETATFGSEFVAARTATDQIIDVRTTLRYFGVPITHKSYMFGDNQSVVTNSTLPHSTLQQRHHALAYHRVREAIASKVISYHWIDGTTNPADILSKHWGMAQAWPLLRPILFCRGDTYKDRYKDPDKKTRDIPIKTNGEYQDPDSGTVSDPASNT